jgi:hypothetical protein
MITRRIFTISPRLAQAFESKSFSANINGNKTGEKAFKFRAKIFKLMERK